MNPDAIDPLWSPVGGWLQAVGTLDLIGSGLAPFLAGAGLAVVAVVAAKRLFPAFPPKRAQNACETRLEGLRAAARGFCPASAARHAAEASAGVKPERVGSGEDRPIDSEVLADKWKAETLAGALEASQAALELAVRGADLGLWYWDVGSGYFELSQEWLARLGFRGESYGLGADVEGLRELLHPDERVLWTAEDAASLAGEEPYDRQFRLRMPDGTFRWVQVMGRANAVLVDGSPESLSGVLIDIHDRRTAELRDAGLAQIIEESYNEVYVTDLETQRFLEVNRGARENLGYSIGELRGMVATDLKTGMTPEERMAILEPILTGREERLEFESVHRRKDGSTYPILVSLQKGRLLDRDVVVAIGVDLTQRQRLETQLAEAQRLEAIGQLAAGVAHEMNTPLQFVGNNIQFLSESSAALFRVIDALEGNISETCDPRPWRVRREELRDLMERNRFARVREEFPLAIHDSREGVERVLQIVRAMKEFTHPGSESMAPTDLNRALSSTATVTRNRWKLAGELELRLDPGLPHVECFAGAINQVFVNLIVNAADAIVQRREYDLCAPPGLIEVRSRQEGDRAVFEFEDNGCGMPEEVRRRAFEPFFTTKEVGKGTGQGLSLCHAIVVQKHHGAIALQSVPGVGTVVRVTLPLVALDGAPSAPQEPVDSYSA